MPIGSCPNGKPQNVPHNAELKALINGQRSGVSQTLVNPPPPHAAWVGVRDYTSVPQKTIGSSVPRALHCTRALQRRITATACMESIFEEHGWASAQHMAQQIRRHALLMGCGQPMERYWHRVPHGTSADGT